MTWTLPHLLPGEAFPPPHTALPAHAPYPGLLAAGGVVDEPSLRAAYAQGIFPWFGPGEPVLWWSPDPRMVLVPGELKVRRSLRQSARRMLADPAWTLDIDGDFAAVMRACAAPRRDGAGTWIDDSIVQAYTALHHSGAAHSFALRHHGELVAGLYLVNIGSAVFGESMFTRVDDGSKVLLMALCGFCKRHALPWIDCQQQTTHLARMGASPWPRERFLQALHHARTAASPTAWTYDWQQFRHDCAAWL